MEAKNCKCICCGKQAVAFYPVFDPDIQAYPYCADCLEKAMIDMAKALWKNDKGMIAMSKAMAKETADKLRKKEKEE